MYAPADNLPKKRATERDFFKSLSELSRHYHIQPESYRSLPYPYNILLTKHELSKILRTKNRRREVSITVDDEQRVNLSVCESLRNYDGAYYIPVMPLYDLWQKCEMQPVAELLTTVFAYLYVEAGLSYYRDEDTYMHYNYEILKDWMQEMEDQEDYREEQQKCLEHAVLAGDYLHAKLLDKDFRKRTGEIVGAYVPHSPYETEALTIARKAWELAQAYPNRNLFEHISPIEEDEDSYGNNTIYMHEYIGFIASATDALSDDLFNMVDTDFNERILLQQPELLTEFNEPLSPYTDQLAYAEQVFMLIDDLCNLIKSKP